VPELGQVNPDLVLASGFEAALDQRRACQRAQRREMRDGVLRLRRNAALRPPKMSERPAKAVASIRNEPRLDARRRHDAVRDRVIDAVDVVRAKLHRPARASPPPSAQTP
jgi:hypothetical protein